MMVAEILGSQSFAAAEAVEIQPGKKGRAVGSLMELYQSQIHELELLRLTSFGKRWYVLQCESEGDVMQYYNCM